MTTMESVGEHYEAGCKYRLDWMRHTFGCLYFLPKVGRGGGREDKDFGGENWPKYT